MTLDMHKLTQENTTQSETVCHLLLIFVFTKIIKQKWVK